MKLTCIMCPVGCELNVENSNGIITVTGNSCIRGERYGISEVTAPTRMVTSLVKTLKGVASVKTTTLVPKDKINDVLNEIANFKAKDVQFGEIIIKNVAGVNGVDVIVTREPIVN